MLEFLRQQLQELLAKRAALESELTAVLEKPKAESRNLTEEERSAFDAAAAALRAHDAEIAEARARVEEVEAAQQRRANADQLAAKLGQTGPEDPHRPRVEVLSEPTQYGRGRRHSYWLDLARTELNRGDGDGGVQAARERLQRHAQELDVDLPKREQRRLARARGDLEQLDRDLGHHRRGLESLFERGAPEQRVAPNRTDGQGGYFVPPLWLIDEYIDFARFGSPIANSVRNLTLPPGTDSINVPKVATGTQTGMQADGGAVTSVDLTDTFVSAPVKTLAGQQDIALQLLDQSPISFDEVVFADLLADYAMRKELQIIAGTGTGTQLKGLLTVAGINAVTYTDADPTLPEMWVPWVQSVSQIFTKRKMPATATFVHPAIWYWACSQLDGNSRPLILPEQHGPFNALALQTGEAAEGPVGRLTVGTPVILAGNMPTNLGAATNETRTITLRTSDQYLWEGGMRSRVLSEVLSGTLQVRLQVYNYLAFMPDRRAESISVISGTGMIPQAGF
ncbi:HK97 family phage major capsid protein [Thermocatellispora tengchongensis]|uniref:HK97 family phage major capsid protein n=1 Tax=Thermocatellispora tengchongensis TaxID=1073253 RepID=A0A840PF20_9ACTN|nr:phage major capsid protein [Thermocatellispora tengchongensis]MBB5137579.1 HK97 family phage major capsid protein [Thermocatellispora tengchongensis]